MPRIRRKIKFRQLGPSSPRLRLKLLSGHDFFFLDEALGDEGTLPEDFLREAWEAIGAELVAEHIADKPGTRLWGWWKWEAEEPRRQIKPGPGVLGPVDWFGMPSQYRGQPPDEMYEAERDCLARLGLLTAAEKQQLARNGHRQPAGGGSA